MATKQESPWGVGGLLSEQQPAPDGVLHTVHVFERTQHNSIHTSAWDEQKAACGGCGWETRWTEWYRHEAEDAARAHLAEVGQPLMRSHTGEMVRCVCHLCEVVRR